ncbi:hypothetical protein ASF26_21550 [Methylobacterium sp. Leaf93]|nr:hypothetical protein ASF26_21550 [Methylobacterium sp. Leaf93]
MIGYLAQLGSTDASIRLTGWPAYKDIEGSFRITEAQICSYLCGLNVGNVATARMLREDFRCLMAMKVQRMGLRRDWVELDGSINSEACRPKAKRDPAATGKEVEHPRWFTLLESRQLLADNSALYPMHCAPRPR